ncbi:class I SAM-dependent methyltransferase [Atopomonas sediminilitoris]|uniref:class I SAM-dependent methyltransferase n=1 Tax=Atopomonas sediminilitoris TaxID=2919919 RepID=UPI001F4E835C|nr:class I SAM-dependent methyltransferase [Atopomonas sediminilitoris]MCJ8168883.1 class I SAM-dependent methyltransferase [Atopomonas sediminilitoris]
MSEPQIHVRLAVQAESAAFTTQASSLAQQLNLPQVAADSAADEWDLLLQVGSFGLRLQELGKGAPGPVWVDFAGGANAHRRQFGGGAGQMVAKAVGVKGGVRPTVLDATAGLGRDAFVLASLGCVVTLIERVPLVAALLADGLARATADPDAAPIVRNMSLLHGDAIALMRDWQGEAPQVIHLDPMFPHRDKSALVKKEMRLFRPLVGDDDDAHDLLAAALALATHRVVVKRPRKAPAVAGIAPAQVLAGQSSRYDIYPLKSLSKL